MLFKSLSHDAAQQKVFLRKSEIAAVKVTAERTILAMLTNTMIQEA